jgi:hypothetical protein
VRHLRNRQAPKRDDAAVVGAKDAGPTLEDPGDLGLLAPEVRREDTRRDGLALGEPPIEPQRQLLIPGIQCDHRPGQGLGEVGDRRLGGHSIAK